MDTGDIIILVTCLVGGAIVVGALVFYFIFQYPKDKEKERLRRQRVEEEYEKEPEYKFRQAQVIEKRKLTYYAGVKMPKLIAECMVTFKTEEGETLKFQLREEIFDAIEDDQQGTLVTVNGNFFDFGDGEEIEAADIETSAQETEE